MKKTQYKRDKESIVAPVEPGEYYLVFFDDNQNIQYIIANSYYDDNTVYMTYEGDKAWELDNIEFFKDYQHVHIPGIGHVIPAKYYDYDKSTKLSYVKLSTLDEKDMLRLNMTQEEKALKALYGTIEMIEKTPSVRNPISNFRLTPRKIYFKDKKEETQITKKKKSNKRTYKPIPKKQKRLKRRKPKNR